MKNYFLHQRQTATAALNAYSSAAAIPVVGYIIAPIAAAMAVAAGAMQVAAIKKQQASQAQDEYQRLMNNKNVFSLGNAMPCMSIA